MDGANSAPGIPFDAGTVHSHNGHRHLPRRNGGASDAGPTRLDVIPSTPAGITRTPILDTSNNPSSIADRPSLTGQLGDAPPSFAQATSAPGSNSALAAAASINAPTAAAAVATPMPILDSRVVLRVGEKQFFTTRATLAESHLLAALLSSNATHDGECFLDADPDMFAEILRFLRTRRFPLFYDHATGYDTGRYGELLVAAQFYQIPTLETWLTGKRYLGAVLIRSEYKAYTLYGTDQIIRMHELCWGREQQGRVLTIQEKNAKVWPCPNQRWRHDGDRMKCAKARCDVLRTPQVPAVQMRVLDITALVTRTEVRESVLSAGAYPEGPPPYEEGDDD